MQARDSKGRFCKCGPKLDEYSYVAGFKIFNSDLTCRDKQYKEGETFIEDKAILYARGMHYCINPFDVFQYYSLFDCTHGISKVANVTGKIKYRAITKHLATSNRDSKVVTTELRIDKVWNVLDYLRLYASGGMTNRYISYYDMSNSKLNLNVVDTGYCIVVDNNKIFKYAGGSIDREILTNAAKNYIYMDNAIIYCAKTRALLEFTGDTCSFAGVDGVHYRFRDIEGKILYEGHIGKLGYILSNTMYRFDAKNKRLYMVGGVGATHL